MREFRFQTISEFHAHKERIRGNVAYVFLLVCLASAAASADWIIDKIQHKPTASASSGTAGFFIIDSGSYAYPKPLSGVSLEHFQNSLTAAVNSWAVVLGRPVEIPPIHFGTCGFVTNALACADRETYAIISTGLESDNKEYDLKSILMHEVGHLLGVPHIDGDALMDPVYQQKLDWPTPAAVALAKLYLEKNK